MKLHNLKNRKWNYVGLAFTFTFVGFLIVMISRLSGSRWVITPS